MKYVTSLKQRLGEVFCCLGNLLLDKVTLHPNIGEFGVTRSSLVFCSKQSPPFQRRAWVDCLYSRGLFRETHKKRIAFCYPSCVERKTRVCPSALCSVYQAITFAQYYTPYSRDTWVVSRCRFRVRLLLYKLQNYSCLRQIYE